MRSVVDVDQPKEKNAYLPRFSTRQFVYLEAPVVVDVDRPDRHIAASGVPSVYIDCPMRDAIGLRRVFGGTVEVAH